jgi:hypothetical protein
METLSLETERVSAPERTLTHLTDDSQPTDKVPLNEESASTSSEKISDWRNGVDWIHADFHEIYQAVRVAYPDADKSLLLRLTTQERTQGIARYYKAHPGPIVPITDAEIQEWLDKWLSEETRAAYNPTPEHLQELMLKGEKKAMEGIALKDRRLPSFEFVEDEVRELEKKILKSKIPQSPSDWWKLPPPPPTPIDVPESFIPEGWLASDDETISKRPESIKETQVKLAPFLPTIFNEKEPDLKQVIDGGYLCLEDEDGNDMGKFSLTTGAYWRFHHGKAGPEDDFYSLFQKWMGEFDGQKALQLFKRLLQRLERQDPETRRARDKEADDKRAYTQKLKEQQFLDELKQAFWEELRSRGDTCPQGKKKTAAGWRNWLVLPDDPITKTMILQAFERWHSSGSTQLFTVRKTEHSKPRTVAGELKEVNGLTLWDIENIEVFTPVPEFIPVVKTEDLPALKNKRPPTKVTE